MDLGLADKVTVITGGSAGIGLAAAKLFATEGARVLIAARREEVLAGAVEEIRRETGASVDAHPVDVTQIADLDRLVAFVREEYGRIDILVNNAGTGIYKPFLEVTDDELVYGMAINFFSQFRLTQRFAPMMIAQGGASIVNITGATGMRVTPPPFRSSCTGPAKAAEIRLSKVLATELGPYGIRVNCIAPGLVWTPERFARWERDMGDGELTEQAAEGIRQEWGAGIALPGHRWGTVDDIAGLILYAASESAGFITGSVFVADGGEDKS